MSVVGGSRAEIRVDVNGADTSRREIETVGDAMRRINAQTLQQVSGQVGGLTNRISSMQSKIGDVASYTVAGLSLAAFVQKIIGATDVLGDLDDMAQKYGATVENLSRLQKVANAFGVDFGTVDAAMGKLATGMAAADEEGGKTQAALAALGISARDTADKLRDPAVVMIEAAKALQRYEDGAGKTALVNDLLGKSGKDLLPYLNDVADNVDEFGAVSKEAVNRVTEMQDNIGRARVKFDELATSVGVDAAPAVNDLATAILDVMRSSNSLASSEGAEWADDLAVGVARVIDVAVTLPKIFTAISGSFKVVAADITFAAKAAYDAHPSRIAANIAAGRNPVADMRAALAERNKVLEEANAARDTLWNEPANQFEQATLKRIAARKTKGSESDAAPDDDKESLDNYLKEKKEKEAKEKAAQDAKKKAEEAAKREIESYTSLITGIRAKTEENRRSVEVEQELTESQKTRIRLDADLTSGKMKLTAAHRAAIDAALDDQAASEQARKEQLAQASATKFAEDGAATRAKSTAALNVEYQMYGKSADAREMAMVAVQAEADMQKKLADMRQAGLPITDKVLAQLKDETASRIYVEQATLGQSKALLYAAQLAEQNRRAEAENIADPQQRAQALLAIDAAVWQERINQAGVGNEARKQLETEYLAWYALRSKQSFADVDLERATQMLQIMESVDDAANEAASGMEQSFGRVGKAIGGLTTALTGYSRAQATIAAQLASALKNSGGDKSKIEKANAEAAKQSAQAQIQSYGDMAGAAKGFFDEHSRGYQAMEAAEKTFRAFEMALAVKTMLEKSGILTAFTSMFVASKATETAASVASVGPDVAASMTKGQAAAAAGVAAQAQGDPYSAWARMAAMAAVMAALGFAVAGGGGSDTTAKDRQAATGTGSILGDATAKSESIAKAIELSAANSSIELNYTAGMLRSLRSIESSISGLGGILAQNGVTGASPASDYGSAQKYGEMLSGGKFGAPFVQVLDKLTGGFISKISGKIGNAIFGGKTSAQDVGVMTNKTTLAGAMAGGLKAQGYADMKKSGGLFHSDKYWTDPTDLGAEADQQFTAIVKNMAKSVTEAGKLLGLGGTAFTQRLDAFVIDIGKISTKGLKPEEIQAQLEAAFSKVADDMARWSVGGLKDFQQAGEGAFETLVRISANYANLDSVLASVGKSFGLVGMSSISVREDFIELAGGIDELASKTASFADNFLTEAERLAPIQKYVAEQLAAMGLSSLRSRESFKQYVVGLDLTNAAQREQYLALMDLQEAFAKVYPEIIDTTVSLSSAKSMLVDAYDAEAEAIRNTMDRMGSFAASLRSLAKSAVLGGLSPLSPQQKYFEAKAQYEAVLAAARGGDESAQSNYQSAFSAFLEASRTVFASGAQYQADFAYAQAATEEAARWAEAQVDVGKAQLTALETQVAGLIEVKKEVMSVRDAVLQLKTIMEQNAAALTAYAPPTVGPIGYAPPALGPINYAALGTSNTTSLVAEIKGLRDDNQQLRAEVAGLRADQQVQTGDIIRGGAVASLNSAETMARVTGAAISSLGRTEDRVAPQ